LTRRLFGSWFSNQHTLRLDLRETYAVGRGARLAVRTGSGGSPARCTFGGRCHCTEARRRLAAAERIGQRAGQRQLGTLLAEVEDHPFEEASCVHDHNGQADLGVETNPDPGVAPLGGAFRLLACARSPPPFSSPSTPCGFL
jgi:hypothetical protein